MIKTALIYLEIIPKADLVNCETELHSLLKGVKLWKSAYSPDAFVRRSIYRLLVILIAKRKEELDPLLISSAVLTSGLTIDQTGSSSDYAKVLVSLSAKMPSVWTHDYQGTGKKAATIRLYQFLRKGSQSGSIAYWTHLGDFIRLLPTTVFIKPGNALEDAGSPYSVLDALHEGIANSEESRTNSCVAWQVYLSTSDRIYASLQEKEKTKLVDSYVFPLVAQYIRPSFEGNRWSITGPQSELVCAKACSQVMDGDDKLFSGKWQDISSQFIGDLKTSLPEQSKDYSKSQDLLVVEASRWYSLQSTLLGGSVLTGVRETMINALNIEVEAEISILKNRNGKPYGAAAALDKVTQLFPEAILSNDTLKTQLYTFANSDLPQLMLSPSVGYLVHFLDLLQWTCDVRQGFSRAAQSVREAVHSPQRANALRALLSSPALSSNEILETIAMTSLDQALAGDDRGDWDAVAAATVNPEAPKRLTDGIIATLIKNLSLDEQPESALHGLEILSRRETQLIREYSATAQGSPLIEKLLFLGDSPDESTAQRALNLSNVLQSKSTFGENGLRTSGSGLAIIKRSFEEVTSESLS